ncbi:MAG: 2-amino-4-hydroxy-6-hydroxymethyldihydropteridine diphosphokinase [Armatimonadota bacterium]
MFRSSGIGNKQMSRVFIGVGSNINPETNIPDALSFLAHHSKIQGISTFYRTSPIYRPDQTPFINGVFEIQTDLTPSELKHILRQIESKLGRIRTDDKYASRTIDLDILVYDDLIITSPELTIPDPDIRNRAFAAIPLCELAPDLIIPGLAEPISDIAKSFEADQMDPLIGFTDLLRHRSVLPLS